ncbi:hypothetical protein Dimus_001764, partial [Dionaea muscipula]
FRLPRSLEHWPDASRSLFVTPQTFSTWHRISVSSPTVATVSGTPSQAQNGLEIAERTTSLIHTNTQILSLFLLLVS